jgi:hypothetical protein
MTTADLTTRSDGPPRRTRLRMLAASTTCGAENSKRDSRLGIETIYVGSFTRIEADRD